jgi:large subunit ribosomal protein L18
MARVKSRNQARYNRKARIRSRINGTADRPRMNVFRSLTDIYVQVIDDDAGHTLASASSIENQLRAEIKNLNKTEQARRVGKELAARARDKGINKVVFDRGGYRYIGRVKALADAAREGGLEF